VAATGVRAEVLFRDEFSGDLSRWQSEAPHVHLCGDGSLCRIEGGRLWVRGSDLYSGDATWTDYKVCVTVEPEGPAGNALIALRSTVFRGSEYVVQVFADDVPGWPWFPNQYTFTRIGGGAGTTLKSSRWLAPIGGTFVMCAAVNGNRISLYLDGVFVDSVSDPEPLEQGRFGIGSERGCIGQCGWEVWYDDVLVVPARCGDGVTQPEDGEECDGEGGNSCSSYCTRCGNGEQAPAEQCDDGNLVDGDACEANCTLPRCGNGILDVGEECDDGNLEDGDGCESSCRLRGCRDGFLSAGEQCDDGNLEDGDGCDYNCTATRCGNGVLSSGEQCDDGNHVAGDGCETDCTRTVGPDAWLVKDINSGREGSSNPSGLLTVGDVTYFFADTPCGRGLWKSDGSTAGTVLVRACLGGSPDRLAALDGTLYFAAADAAHGMELWKSDGTEAGTVLFKDVSPGTASSTPRHAAVVGGVLYFAADDGTHGVELWRSDGTEAGTMLLRDINPGASSSDPRGLTGMNGVLYFGADDGVHGRELWRSDGTVAGTELAADVWPGRAGSDPAHLVDLNGTLLFAANHRYGASRELFRSDGTAAGTAVVTYDDRNPEFLTVLDGRVYFAASAEETGRELWHSDGTEAGTELVADIRDGVGSSNPRHLAVAGETLYFAADDPWLGMELWRSDGTAAGTMPVKNIALDYFGPYGSEPSDLVDLGGALLFAARDRSFGRELWRSDGTIAGTTLVKDVGGGAGAFFAPGEWNGYPTASRNSLRDLDGMLLFRASVALDGGFPLPGQYLWRSDGTASGTQPVTERVGFYVSGGLNVFPIDSFAAPFAGTLFMAGVGAAGNDIGLWKSDGTEMGTVLIRDRLFPQELTVLDGTLLFSALGEASGRELWRSDGTEAGTALVKDIWPGGADSITAFIPFPCEGCFPFSCEEEPCRGWLVTANRTLFFAADDGTSGRELWRSDGTEEGTVKVADIHRGAVSSAPRFLTSVGGRVFFTAEDGASGRELWVSDGSAGGTMRVTDLVPGAESADLAELTAFDGALFFTVDDALHGRELWRSDGTDGGTVLVADIRPGAESSEPRHLTATGARLLFAANDGVLGEELWASDGTAARTALVADINPGAASSGPTSLVDVAGTLFFSADDGAVGREVWRSDGTVAGTRLVADVAARGESSNPADFTLVGSTVFFTADEGSIGRELWAASLAGPQPSRTPTPSPTVTSTPPSTGTATTATTPTGTPTASSTLSASATLSPSGAPPATTQPGDGGGGGCTLTARDDVGAAWWLLVLPMALWWALRRSNPASAV
jgi:ELWxxDGT repeat protein/cysteine-rich repeat protein